MSSDMETVHPFTGVALLFAPRGRDLVSLIVHGPGWSVINPSTTRSCLSSLVCGINCDMQLPRKSNINNNI
jgi:hypothetical protein